MANKRTQQKNYPYVTLPVIEEGEEASGGGTSSSGGAAEAQEFDEILNEMMEQFSPELIDYRPTDEQTLAEQIALWLRPVYAQSISERERQTERYNAELDADALARGMGSSTYVSDMKNRNFGYEAQDIVEIESEYGATLAKYLFDAMEADRERQLEVETFNANAKNEAYDRAYSAAESLYAAYLENREQSNSRGGSGGSGSSGARTQSTSSSSPSYNAKDRAQAFYEMAYDNIPATSYENCEAYLSGLTPKERKSVYTATSGKYLRIRAELQRSLSKREYNQLKNRYSASK